VIQIEQDLQDIFKLILGYPHEFILSITFEKNKIILQIL